mgnify:CR=1 FL=1
MNEGALKLNVVCTQLPGLRFDALPDACSLSKEPVYLGIQKGTEVVDRVPGNRRRVTFRPEFRICTLPDGGPNFLGPYAKGKPADRFFYLSWGIVDDGGGFTMFRRLKIWLTHLEWPVINASMRSDQPIVARVRMSDSKGEPLCGGPGENIKWDLGRAGSGD